MEVRKITADDFVQLAKLHSVVYNHVVDDFTITDARAAWSQHSFGVFDGSRLVSAMTSHGFAMRYDGSSLPISGIGGVGTMPEARNQGLVRRLFDAVFADMKERGLAFSTLYPFSIPYYRMFGYEVCYTRNSVEIATDSLPAGFRTKTKQPPLRSEMITAATDDMQALYAAFAADRTLAFDRDDRLWARIVSADPYKEQVYSYLFRDEHDTARGYVTFKLTRNPGSGSTLEGRDVVFDSTATLAGMLPFLGGFFPRATKVCLHLPTDARAELVVTDQHALSHSVVAHYMGRVVDVETMLRATRFGSGGSGSDHDAHSADGAGVVPAAGAENPAGRLPAGGLDIRVHDGLLAWNDATFHVEWTGDGAPNHVQRLLTTGPRTGIDYLEIDIRRLTQLLAGFVDGNEACRYGFCQDAPPAAVMQRLFPHKTQYQNDGF